MPAYCTSTESSAPPPPPPVAAVESITTIQAKSGMDITSDIRCPQHPRNVYLIIILHVWGWRIKIYAL